VTTLESQHLPAGSQRRWRGEEATSPATSISSSVRKSRCAHRNRSTGIHHAERCLHALTDMARVCPFGACFRRVKVRHCAGLDHLLRNRHVENRAEVPSQMVDNREGKANVRFTLQRDWRDVSVNSLMVLSAISLMMWCRIRSSDVPAVEAFHFFRQNGRYSAR
jgi:hypothetical protein